MLQSSTGVCPAFAPRPGIHCLSVLIIIPVLKWPSWFAIQRTFSPAERRAPRLVLVVFWAALGASLMTSHIRVGVNVQQRKSPAMAGLFVLTLRRAYLKYPYEAPTKYAEGATFPALNVVVPFSEIARKEERLQLDGECGCRTGKPQRCLLRCFFRHPCALPGARQCSESGLLRRCLAGSVPRICLGRFPTSERRSKSSVGIGSEMLDGGDVESQWACGLPGGAPTSRDFCLGSPGARKVKSTRGPCSRESTTARVAIATMLALRRCSRSDV